MNSYLVCYINQRKDKDFLYLDSDSLIGAVQSFMSSYPNLEIELVEKV